MQTYVDEKLGGDGGRIQLVNDEGVLKLQLSFPARKVIDAAKAKLREPAIALVKKAIPGERFDGYAVNVVDGLLGLADGVFGSKDEPKELPVNSEAAKV